MAGRRKKRGRPATGRDPVVPVRVPPKVLEKIEKLAEALGTDRSSAIRYMLDYGLGHDSAKLAPWVLLRKGKTGGLATAYAAIAVETYKSLKIAEFAKRRSAKRAQPADEIRVLRAAERAAERASAIGDKIALRKANKEAPPPTSTPTTRPRSLRRQNPSDAEVKAAVERAVSRSSR